jgi:hypothetical protein
MFTFLEIVGNSLGHLASRTISLLPDLLSKSWFVFVPII